MAQQFMYLIVVLGLGVVLAVPPPANAVSAQGTEIASALRASQ